MGFVGVIFTSTSVGLVVLFAFCFWEKALSFQERVFTKNPVIIVSMDGMYWKVFENKLVSTHNLDFVARTGVSAKAMRSVTPSLTYPNHHSILTGLYPESHGIISNQFWDPFYNETFVFEYTCSSMDPKFYNTSEPIWLTLQKRNGRAGVYFWPGFAGYSQRPSFYEKERCFPGINCSKKETYKDRSGVHCAVNHNQPYSSRIDRAIEWLQSEHPPQFVALYFDQPDPEGHQYGPNSTEFFNAVRRVDSDVVGYLLQQLYEKSMLDSVNLIFVSDHGFVGLDPKRVILLKDYITPDSYRLFSEGTMAHIWPNQGKEEEIYKNLTTNKHPHIKVYRQADIPEILHWKHNRRIPPLWVQPDPGWLILSERYDVGRGGHGYPATCEDMWSVFFARGPAFREGFVNEVFDVVDLYPLMCNLLGIEPLPNNGSFENVKMMLKNLTPKVSSTHITLFHVTILLIYMITN